jgi:hypothetical protein
MSSMTHRSRQARAWSVGAAPASKCHSSSKSSMAASVPGCANPDGLAGQVSGLEVLDWTQTLRLAESDVCSLAKPVVRQPWAASS